MRDKTGEVWAYGLPGWDQQILVVVSSDAVNEIHRCVVLWVEHNRGRTHDRVGDIRHLGDWDDRNSIWTRLS